MARARLQESRVGRAVTHRFGLLMERAGWERRAPELPDDVLEMGRGSYFRPDVIVHEGDIHRVRIGNFCSIAANVEFMPGGNHRVDWVSMYPFRIMFDLPGRGEDGHPTSKGDIVVGHDVWIGRGARILSGVRIGNGAVVGAFSVVAGDVGPYQVVVGNPARVVKQRFPDATIAALEAMAWWEWPDDVLVERVGLLSSGRVDEFIAEFGGDPT